MKKMVFLSIVFTLLAGNTAAALNKSPRPAQEVSKVAEDAATEVSRWRSDAQHVFEKAIEDISSLVSVCARPTADDFDLDCVHQQSALILQTVDTFMVKMTVAFQNMIKHYPQAGKVLAQFVEEQHRIHELLGQIG